MERGQPRFQMLHHHYVNTPLYTRLMDSEFDLVNLRFFVHFFLFQAASLQHSLHCLKAPDLNLFLKYLTATVSSHYFWSASRPTHASLVNGPCHNN